MKKIILFLLFSVIIKAQWSISTSERNALIAIYQQSNGTLWSQPWNLEKDPYYWYGVKISNGIVTELKLNGNLLEGNFPNAILSLSNLKKLDLSSNKLSGNIPNLSSLNSLVYLNISNNEFTGDIWNSFSSLANLEELYIGNNNGTISNADFSGFTNLKHLDIARLNLTEIPSSLGTLNKLSSLNLSNNSITNFTNITPLIQLEEINLSGNALTKVPEEINNFLNLKTLNLSNNKIAQFSTLNSLHNLEWLSLENNNLNNIPTEITALEKLTYLNLSRNNISGGTGMLSTLINLEQLWLNHNKLKGSIPTNILSLPKLMNLSLQSNEFEGNIPDNLPDICNISNNRFSKNNIENYLQSNPENTDFVYSPQRYDEAKTVKAAINSSINLDQALSSSEGFQFYWLKTLDKNTSVNSENFTINSVKETDYDTYTCEALFIKNDTLYNVYFSDYREPITLENAETLGTDNPENKILVIYPNPTKDHINIKNKNYKIETFSLYDLGGRIIKTFSGKETKLDLSNLPSSTYILNIKTPEGAQSFKIIKK